MSGDTPEGWEPVDWIATNVCESIDGLLIGHEAFGEAWDAAGLEARRVFLCEVAGFVREHLGEPEHSRGAPAESIEPDSEFVAIDCKDCKDAPAMHVCDTCGTDGAILVRRLAPDAPMVEGECDTTLAGLMAMRKRRGKS